MYAVWGDSIPRRFVCPGENKTINKREGTV